MEQVKIRVKVRVFTRSQESCKVHKPDRPLMKKWFNDLSIPTSYSYKHTANQKNYFYNYREGI